MDNQPLDNERFNFVNEMLTGEELLERLAAAQDVVSSLTTKFFAAQDVIESLREDVKDRNEIIKNMQVQMVDIAGDIARAGGQTHKDKDEILLIAISRLLSWGISGNKMRYADDTPF